MAAALAYGETVAARSVALLANNISARKAAEKRKKRIEKYGGMKIVTSGDIA